MINPYRRAARQVNELKLVALDPLDAALAGVVAKAETALVLATPAPEQTPNALRRLGQTVGQTVRRTA